MFCPSLSSYCFCQIFYFYIALCIMNTSCCMKVQIKLNPNQFISFSFSHLPIILDIPDLEWFHTFDLDIFSRDSIWRRIHFKTGFGVLRVIIVFFSIFQNKPNFSSPIVSPGQSQNQSLYQDKLKKTKYNFFFFFTIASQSIKIISINSIFSMNWLW